MGGFTFWGSEYVRRRVDYYYQGFSSFIDGTVLTVTTGRDGTVKPSSKWNRGPVPSTISPTVNSYRPVPSRKSLPFVALYGPVPLSKYRLTVPSRGQNLPLPSRPVYKTYSYCPVALSKRTHTVPSRRQNLSLPSRPAIQCRHSFP